jgi:hypothetical protein
MKVKIEVPPGPTGVGADQASAVGLVNGLPQMTSFLNKLAADVDVTSMGADGERGEQAAFHQFVRIITQDFAVLAGSRLGLVGIDNKVAGQRAG